MKTTNLNTQFNVTEARTDEIIRTLRTLWFGTDDTREYIQKTREATRAMTTDERDMTMVFLGRTL